jgi:hypothetical protein
MKQSRTLLSKGLWNEIMKRAADSKTRRAAIAYVSTKQFLDFGKGDVLIADASDVAIAAGVTSARVLERALNRGAKVYSRARLHAKVVLLDEFAIVGSANLSRSSANSLVEASWITNERRTRKLVQKFIESLQISSERVDKKFIDRIKKIEVRPRVARAELEAAPGVSEPAVPVLAYFQEVKRGDVKKFNAKSNLAKTGGGARDLRVRPASRFQYVLRQLFDQPGEDLSMTRARVHWKAGRGKSKSAIVELWRPTTARPKELRIARFNMIKGWKIDLVTFGRQLRDGGRCFYVLEMDAEGTVWARLVFETRLNREDPAFAKHVRTLVSEHHGKSSIRGAVDLITGRKF